MKKLLLIIALLISALGLNAQSVTIGDLEFTVTSETPAECEVSGYSGKPTDVTIPSTVTISGMEFSVTSIGDDAFTNCGNLTSIELPNGVTSIGYYAFSCCYNLTSIELPNGVTSIGYYAFQSCDLTSIYCYAENVPETGGSAFDDCPSDMIIYVPAQSVDAYKAASPWNEYTIEAMEEDEDIVVNVGDNTIIDYGGYSLKFTVTSIEPAECKVVCETKPTASIGITIPSSVTIEGTKFSVTSIGNGAFSGCSNLTSIEIPNSVTSIGGSAFRSCSSLTSIEIPSGVTYIGEWTFSNCSSLTSIEIPSGVTSIGYKAFSGCSSLTSIEIPSGVTSIGSSAFYECSSLTSLEIPSSVTSIEILAFYGCSSLTSIEIPNSVTSIYYEAFANCSNLTSIVVESGNTVYDSRDNCNAIIETATNTLIAGCQNTVIPNSVTSIGGSAFYGCSSLTSIEIPSSVTSIGEYAFSNCSSLTSIEIPSGVTSIGNYAFEFCYSLTSIYCYAENVIETSSSAFNSCHSDMVIYVPAQSVGAYQAASPWNKYTIMAMEVQPTPSNKRHCLLSITQDNNWDNLTYVYESQTSNKVVRVLKGVDQGYGMYVTVLEYDDNGVIIGSEYKWLENNGALTNSNYIDEYEYTYTEGVLTSYTQASGYDFYGTPTPVEYVLTHDANGNVETVDCGTNKIVYTYEDGKLVKEVMVYVMNGVEETEYEIDYAYENGNCISATQYSVLEGERIARKATEYFYDLTVEAEDVFSFVYPHEVKPASVNVLTKELSYEYQEDYFSGAITKSNIKILTYNYNFAVESVLFPPMSLSARAISDTEIELSWVAIEETEKFAVYQNDTYIGESESTYFTVEGLTANTEYCFTVKGVNGEVESEASEAVCAKTMDVVSVEPTTIAFGELRLGEYWSESEVTVSVSIIRLGKTITSITCDDAFFTLPTDIDLTSDYIWFEMGYDKTAAAGEYTATLTVTLESGVTVEIPVTATAYAPATPDVFELAQAVTFTEGVYTDTPDFATLHDDYAMPNENEWDETDAPDAVYSFTLEEESVVSVSVTGDNAAYAIFQAEGFEAPYEGNVFTGEVKNLNTEFVYNFDNNSLADFTIVDNDEYKDFTWAIEEGEKGYQLVSYSFYGWYAEDNSWAWINKADERLITNNAYPISAKSVLSFDMNVNGAFEEIIIEVTKDGESFTEIEKIEEVSYSYDWLAKSVNVGEKFAELGLEYGDYQIVLYHKIDGYGELNIDNLVLAERETIYPEGRYYLFAAAEKDLSVNIAIEAVTLVDPEEPFYPTTTNHWVPDESLYANNMSVIGLIQIDGVNQNSTSLEIGAFCGEEVRGSQLVQYIPALDKYLVFLTIHGEGSEEISFKLYDHSIGEELDLRSPEAITFAVNGTLGSVTNPYILNFSNMVEITASVNPSEAGSVFGTGIYAVNDVVTLTTAPNEGFSFKNWTVNGNVVSTDSEYSFVVTEAVELVANYNYVQTRELKSGWSWFSSFIEFEGEEGLEMMEYALGENGLQIKNQTEFVVNSDGAWYGSLMAANSDMMFMLETSAPQTFTLVGPKVNPEEHPLTVGTNWRWISYPLDINLSVEEALATIVPQTGDYIKSKNAFSQYYEGAGWLGALSTMNPGEGYMYQNVSGTTKTLVYPSESATRSVKENVTAENNYWVPNAGKFATNMSVIAVVESNGIEMSDYEVAAFVGDEIRGSARPIYIEVLDKHMIFMTVYGSGKEEITFKYYDINADAIENVTSREEIVFADNATYGSVDNAIVLTCGVTGIGENDTETLNVYPNPANVNAEISLGMTYDRVEIYNAIGVKIAEYADVNRIGGIETSGVYLIKAMNDEEARNCRIVIR